MPIPVKIVDSKSEVKVKPKSNSSVKVESDCETQAKRVEALIDKERKERIAADENLQEQIDAIQGKKYELTFDETYVDPDDPNNKCICLKEVTSSQ